MNEAILSEFQVLLDQPQDLSQVEEGYSVILRTVDAHRRTIFTRRCVGQRDEGWLILEGSPPLRFDHRGFPRIATSQYRLYLPSNQFKPLFARQEAVMDARQELAATGPRLQIRQLEQLYRLLLTFPASEEDPPHVAIRPKMPETNAAQLESLEAAFQEPQPLDQVRTGQYVIWIHRSYHFSSRFKIREAKVTHSTRRSLFLTPDEWTRAAFALRTGTLCFDRQGYERRGRNQGPDRLLLLSHAFAALLYDRNMHEVIERVFAARIALASSEQVQGMLTLLRGFPQSPHFFSL